MDTAHAKCPLYNMGPIIKMNFAEYIVWKYEPPYFGVYYESNV